MARTRLGASCVLIFVLAGLHGVGLGHLAFYPVLVLYSLPWGKRWVVSKCPAASGKA